LSLKIINCSARLRNFVKEFGKDIFSCDHAAVYFFAKVCGVKVTAEKKYNIQQPIARGRNISTFFVINIFIAFLENLDSFTAFF